MILGEQGLTVSFLDQGFARSFGGFGRRHAHAAPFEPWTTATTRPCALPIVHVPLAFVSVE
jgi:hypothetical protein